jgi:glycosyltransferase involved in cell wall biosynthesis
LNYQVSHLRGHGACAMFRHGWGTPLETIFHGDWYTALAVDTWGEKWELLVIDDGSTDATLAILQRLHAQDPRVKMHLIRPKFWHCPPFALPSGFRPPLSSLIGKRFSPAVDQQWTCGMSVNGVTENGPAYPHFLATGDGWVCLRSSEGPTPIGTEISRLAPGDDARTRMSKNRGGITDLFQGFGAENQVARTGFDVSSGLRNRKPGGTGKSGGGGLKHCGGNIHTNSRCLFRNAS